MSGVTLSDLSKYHQGAMKWFKDGLVSEHNRLFAQTEEAGAVSFWPLGGTPLEGRIKFSFKETPPASGDKGPENPSTISGVSAVNVKRFGKNCMVLYPNMNATNLQYTKNEDGTIRVYGTIPASRSEDFISLANSGNNYTSVHMVNLFKRETAYTASFKSTDPNLKLQIYSHRSSGYTSLAQIAVNRSATFTLPADADQMCWIRIQGARRNNADTSYDGVCQVQIELGSEATEMELPAVMDSYDVSLGSTYYGGEIDLATGVMTVTHFGKTVANIDASDGLLASDSDYANFRIWPRSSWIDGVNSARPKSSSTIVCDKLPTINSGNVERITLGSYNSTNLTAPISGIVKKSRLNLSNAANQDSPTVAEVRNAVNAYIASNPLTFAYELYTPYTVQLTPLQLTALTQKDKYTPRMNTVYTDADSIQIRYRKSLIHDEDEKVQAIVALGGNV